MTSIGIAALAAAVAVCAVVAGDVRADTTKQKLQAKQAQARGVLAEVNALDQRFEASVEAWHGAQYELAATRVELQKDQAQLRLSERQRRAAYARVRARLVALYESDNAPTTIGILLGSSNVGDMIDRLEDAGQIAASDHRLAAETSAAARRYETAEQKTAAAARRRAADVAQRDAQRRQIATLLGERRRLLSTVQGEVAQLQQQEVHEQAVLAAQARARLAADEAAAAAQARARAAAAAAAAKAKAAAPPPPAPTTTAAATPTTTTDPATTTAPVTTTVAAPPPAVTPSAGPGHPQAAAIAMRYLGVKYVWGGASPSGFDCSGLVMYVYAQLGIQLPHFAAAQFGMGTPVARADLQPGDLVFFDNLNHVGIYVGGGDMIHAPDTGDVVKITPISDFGNRYVGARRL